jgi:hypothetical protein
MGSRSTFCNAEVGCLVSLRVAADFGAAFAGGATSTELSRFSSGLREAVFLRVWVSAAGASRTAAFVVAARALVVLVVGGAAVAAAFVRVETRVEVAGFGAMNVQSSRCA